MPLTMIVTNAGRAALVNAANTGTAPVTIAQVGLSATAVTPLPTATALPGEFKRLATLSGDVVADDMIHLIVRDEGLDVFTVRSLALYLADGTLFAVYGQAGVIVEKSAQAMLLLAVDIKFEDVDAATLTFGDANFLNPPATTEIQGVVELATLAEAQAGIDALRALTPAAAKAAVLGWLLLQDGAGSGLDADLLDGQQGSYYLAAAAYTAADVLAKLLTVDGAGSGLNADLLDGQQGSYYLAVAAYTAADVLAKLLIVDGAGSGLDADLLDGQHGSYYADIAARLGYTPARGSGHLGNGDLNTATTSGMFRFDAPTNGPAGVSYGQLVVMHGASDTITQILGDYTTGTLWTRSGNPPNVGGAGSWGTWKALVSASSGSTYSAADVLAKLLTVDGSGSGLDADLLDGQHAGYFTNIIARLGYTPLNKAGDSVLGPLIFGAGSGLDLATNDIWASMRVFRNAKAGGDGMFIGYGNANNGPTRIYGAGSTARFVCPDVNGNLFIDNGTQYWHSSNDGAGSGLDADMVDGWHRDDIRAWGNLLNKPFNWSGQAGQPSWLWGSNDGSNYYVWNPSNFSVNYANSAGALSTASGAAPSYAARAWVSFDGIGTVAITGSGNVSSITDNGVGSYTVNFATAMPDTNYCAVPWGRSFSTTGYREAMAAAYANDTKSTTAFQFRTGATGGDQLKDASEACVIIMR